jgi:hypothetical protein
MEGHLIGGVHVALDAGDQELLITTGIHVRALDGAP